MPTGKYKRKYIPGRSAYRRLYTSNHYHSKGLDYDLFLKLCKESCYYCGEQPALVNPYKSIQSFKGITADWLFDQIVCFNGVDKKIHKEDYKDTSNLVSCCKKCNIMKQRHSDIDFIEHAKKIAQHQKYKTGDWDL